MSDHDHNDGGHHHTEPMAVAVITPSGTFPNDDNYRRSYDAAHVEKILKAAAVHLHLTNTGDWVAYVDNRQIDPAKTFAENDLCGVVEIEWHKHEGGGGA